MTADPNNSRIYYPELTGDPIVDALYSRVTWGLDNLNETITYAFPDSTVDYGAYHAQSPNDELNSFTAFSAAQQSDTLSILRTSAGSAANDGFSVEGFTTASFVAGTHETANIRLANSGVASNSIYGWAYYAFPDQIMAGDVWISNEQYGYQSPVPGNVHHWVLTHEIGHSLGLDHSWEKTHGTLAVDLQHDSQEYTVMSYNGYSTAGGAQSDWNEINPNSFAQTFMMYDIYVLQYLYGVDNSVNSGNTVYHWEPTSGKTYVNGVVGINPSGNRIFATLWDGGGFDTYDLSRYTSDLVLDLNAGGASRFSDGQRANLGDGVAAAGNIYNALLFGGNTSSLIEAAIGGSGADTITGNQINNVLTGNGGADTINGKIGNDTLAGNGGADMVNGGEGSDVLTGGSNADTFHFRSPNVGNDIVTDWQDGTDIIRLTNTTLTTFAQVQANAYQIGADVVIVIDGSTDSITINNWTLAQMSTSDFVL